MAEIEAILVRQFQSPYVRGQLNAKAWFPYGRKRVVTVVEVCLQSISTTVTTRLRHIYRPYGNQA